MIASTSAWNDSKVASERIAAKIAERIHSGELPPGSRIKQDYLAEELQTSRIPVRDALRILEARGLVTMRANSGARVLKLTVRDIEMMIEIRARLEPLLLAESMPNLRPSDMEAMHEALVRLEASDKLAEKVVWARRLIWLACSRHGTPNLADMVQRVSDQFLYYRNATMRIMCRRGFNRSFVECRLLYDAICQKQVAAAQTALALFVRQALYHFQLCAGEVFDGENAE